MRTGKCPIPTRNTCTRRPARCLARRSPMASRVPAALQSEDIAALGGCVAGLAARMRFEVLKRDAEIGCLQAEARGEDDTLAR